MLVIALSVQAENIDIECARVNNGQILQIYYGEFDTESKHIIINSKDYSHKYIMGTTQTVRDLLRIGYKMHICIKKEES